MTEHTPIPWTIGPSSNPRNGTAWRDILSTGGVFAPSYVGEALERDAELIVRAVNTHALMLDALRRVEKWASGYGTLTQSEMREFVREAIRAAEGEAVNG